MNKRKPQVWVHEMTEQVKVPEAKPGDLIGAQMWEERTDSRGCSLSSHVPQTLLQKSETIIKWTAPEEQYPELHLPHTPASLVHRRYRALPVLLHPLVTGTIPYRHSELGVLMLAHADILN